MPYFSIVTVTLNNAGGLRRTLESVLTQKFQDYEHLVIDGGSVDGSMTILSKCRSSNLRVLSEKDHGIYDAMNKGIRLAKSNYTIFINSGDELYDENVLERLHRLSVVDETKLYFGSVAIVENGEEQIKIPCSQSQPILQQICPPAHPSMAFPTTYLKDNPYSMNYKLAADHQLKLMSLGSLKFSYVHFAISKFHIGGLSSRKDSRTIAQFLKERTLIELNYFNKLLSPLILTKNCLIYLKRMLCLTMQH